MKSLKLTKRFLTPSPVVTIIYWLKFKCLVSPRAEVDLSKLMKIGSGSSVGSFTKIKAADGPLTIGKFVDIGTNCFIAAGKGGIKIGDHSMIAPGASIVGNNYRYDRLDIPMREQEQTSKGVEIADNVWVGAGAIVLDGANIQEGVIVTPNSVVSAKIPANSIVQGNPAKVVFERR